MPVLLIALVAVAAPRLPPRNPVENGEPTGVRCTVAEGVSRREGVA